jgi:hypothetical protein
LRAYWFTMLGDLLTKEIIEFGVTNMLRFSIWPSEATNTKINIMEDRDEFE